MRGTLAPIEEVEATEKAHTFYSNKIDIHSLEAIRYDIEKTGDKAHTFIFDTRWQDRIAPVILGCAVKYIHIHPCEVIVQSYDRCATLMLANVTAEGKTYYVSDNLDENIMHEDYLKRVNELIKLNKGGSKNGNFKKECVVCSIEQKW